MSDNEMRDIFIKLHVARDGKIIYVNPTELVSFREGDEGKGSSCRLTGIGSSLEVSESPAQINAELERVEFERLTEARKHGFELAAQIARFVERTR